MALVLEDGTGIATANAYVDSAYVITHLTDRAKETAFVAGTSGQQDAACIRATDYIEKRFGPIFRGLRRNKDQGLEWPRIDATDNDDFMLDTPGLPPQLQKAAAEYAKVAFDRIVAGTELAPEGGVSGTVKKDKKVVGPIEVEKEYAVNSPTRALQSALVSDSTLPEIPEADLWLEELIEPPGSFGLARA